MNIPSTGDLTFAEVSALAGISVRTVRRLVHAGELPAIRYNHKVVRVPIGAWREYRERVIAASRQQLAAIGRNPTS